MTQCLQEVFPERINTTYYHRSPFAEERARYLDHLRARGWARATLIGTACKLAAFAARVDITWAGLTAAQIEAAANDWMKQPVHHFRRDIGPHKARRKFISDATNWLRFLGYLREPECLPSSHAELLTAFARFLDQERGLSSATVNIRRKHVGAFLSWFELQHRPFSKVTVLEVERFLALPRSRPWSRVTIAGCVA
jgi:integrase/recombinase XerD